MNIYLYILNRYTKGIVICILLKITRSLGLVGLFEYVCALSQNRSNYLTKYICSVLRIFKIERQTQQFLGFLN